MATINFTSLPTEIHFMISDSLEYLEDVNVLIQTCRFFYFQLNNSLYRRIARNTLDPVESHLMKDNVINERITVLHWAARNGNHDAVRRLLQAGIPADPTQETLHPIMLAAYHGHAETVRTFLEYGVDPTPQTGFDMPRYLTNNPLTEAASSGQESVVKLLIDYGVPLEFGPESSGIVWQPLYLAVINGQIGVAKLLLDQGVSPLTPNYKEKEEISGLKSNALLSSNSFEMLQLLLDKVELPELVDFTQPDGLLPNLAREKLDLLLVKFLFNFAKPPEEQITYIPASGRLWPHPDFDYDIFSQFAYTSGSQPEVAQFLLDQIDIDGILGCQYIRPIIGLMHGAARMGDKPLLSKLFQVDWTRKRPFIKDGDWGMILTRIMEKCIRYGHIDIIELLLMHGADADGTNMRSNRRDGLHERLSPYRKAIKRGLLGIADLLLDYGADPFQGGIEPGVYFNVDNPRVRWPRALVSLLEMAASSVGTNLTTALFLIKKNPTIYRVHGVVAAAATKGKETFNMVRDYVEPGVPLQPDNSVHQRAMVIAAEHGHIPLLVQFLEAGFHPNKLGVHNSCLGAVAMSTSIKFKVKQKTINFLLENGEEIDRNFGWDSITPLMSAIRKKEEHSKDDEKVIRLLIEKGANPFQFGMGAKLKFDQFALYKAVHCDNLPMIKVILQFLQEKDIPFDQMKSIVETAASRTNWRVAKLLWRWYWSRCIHQA
ncbi:ankyrin [Penicillium malachiteum]|uniref:ankyrin n=1 Tax=Penicillium malachiteum TaxID=1324776 RepID=UPI0025492C7B|nr:ankyrin [Penicillium malachiteum]KAJ5737560.1 ankyrin [Penicillium malachiteum]